MEALRTLCREPLQYVLGAWGFRTLDLLVDRRVLIPRPETEATVEVALERAKRVDDDPVVVVDLLGRLSRTLQPGDAQRYVAVFAIGIAAIFYVITRPPRPDAITVKVTMNVRKLIPNALCV